MHRQCKQISFHKTNQQHHLPYTSIIYPSTAARPSRPQKLQCKSNKVLHITAPAPVVGIVRGHGCIWQSTSKYVSDGCSALYIHNIHRMSRRHSLTSFSRSFEASMSSLFLDCVRTIQLTDMQPTTHSSQTTHGQAWTANHTQLTDMQPTQPIIHNMRGIAFHCHWPYM